MQLVNCQFRLVFWVLLRDDVILLFIYAEDLIETEESFFIALKLDQRTGDNVLRLLMLRR